MKKILIYIVTIILVISTIIILIQISKSKNEALKIIKIGYQPSTHHVAEFVAFNNKWFEKATGLKFIDIEFPTGPPEMEAMLAGVLDVAYVGASATIPALSRNMSARIVSCVQSEGSALIVRNGINYLHPKSLLKMKIGCFPPGSIQYTVFAKWLRKKDIDINNLDIRSMGPREIVESIDSDALDAAILPDPFPELIEERNIGKVVMTSGEMWPNHPCCVMLMSKKLISEYPEIAEIILAVHIISTDYINDNPENAISISMKKIQIDEKICRASLPGFSIFHTEVKSIISGVIDMAKVHYELGLTKDSRGNPILLSQNDLFEIQVYQRAQKRIPEIRKILGLIEKK